MKEYIEREAMVKASCERCNGEYVPCNKEHCLFMEVIHSIPAADVRPVVRGRWKKSYADHEAFGVRPFFRYCSECHEATVHQYNYCPNCGAKMDAGEASAAPTEDEA